MSLFEILLISFALSIDACVVSFTYGMNQKNNVLRSMFSLAIFTGVFQGLMPLLGGLCTECVRCYIEPFSKWIVFLVFLYLGISFIKQSFEKHEIVKDLSIGVLFMIAVATSIDAFSAGIPICLKNDCIILPVLLIAIVTFIDSILGFSIARIFHRFNARYLNIVGGCILIILALKVVF